MQDGLRPQLALIQTRVKKPEIISHDTERSRETKLVRRADFCIR
jgi:hypothetical protein